MKRYFILATFILFTANLQSCPVNPGDYDYGYSPLTKYTNFPLNRIVAEQGYAMYNEGPEKTSNYRISYNAINGILYNNWYYYLPDTNVCAVSNSQSATIYTFGSISGIQFLAANNRYIAYLSGSNMIVIDTNNATNFITNVDPNKLICYMAYGNSSIIAYGEYKPKNTVVSQYWTIVEDRFSLNIVNLTNKNIKTFDTVYGVVGFSRKGKYLFYTYDNSLYYSYSDQSDKVYPRGQLAYYDIVNDRNYIVGNLNHEQHSTNSSHWSDCIIGFSEDTKKFYVAEIPTDYIASSRPYDDGRWYYDVCGLWSVDISSLGLSE